MLDDHLGMAHHLFYQMKLGKYSLLVLGKESPRRTQNMISSSLETIGPLSEIPMEVLSIRKHSLYHTGEICKTSYAMLV